MASTSYQARDCIDNISLEGGAFEEPNICPRIGDEYQPELPPIMKRSEYILNSSYYGDTHAAASFQKHVLVGMRLSLMRINNEGPEKNLDKNFTGGEQDSVKPQEDTKIDEMKKFCGDLVPGLTCQTCSDAEKDSFLLGLHIFEKDFVELRRFVGTKNLGDLLAYYYGEFYHSNEYFKWSERRTVKGRKRYVFGQKIFTGLKQQELISRLVAGVSVECKSALLEVSKAFSDEKTTLSIYVSSLKAMVGIKALVEAIAIGQGKKDLTRMALPPSGPNRVIHDHKQPPLRKPCSSLTATEIIEILNGDCRLSKARTNELFWEAVWPRLLARGWTTEKVPPGKGDAYNGLNLFLIYLTPGGKNVQWQDRVKGDHYFDSATNVLDRVSREPGLILLGTDSRENGDENGNGNGPKADGEEDGGLRSYMQLQAQNRSLHAVKYTVVDTSHGGKLRDMSCLPCETAVDVDCSGNTELDVPMEESGKKPGKAGKGKKRGRAHGKTPVSKRFCKVSGDDTHEERGDGLACSLTSPGMEVEPKPPSASLLEVGGQCEGGAVAPTCSVENSRAPLPFDLNELPQIETDQDDRPTVAERENDRSLI